MKAKFIYEVIKHLPPRSEEELEKNFQKENEEFITDLKTLKNEKLTFSKIIYEKQEYEVSYNFGKYNDFFYIAPHINTEMFAGDIITTKILLDKLELLLEKLLTSQNLSVMTDIFELLNSDEVYNNEIFGAETYNGWNYEDAYENYTHNEAIFMTLLFCIVKCKVFLDLRK